MVYRCIIVAMAATGLLFSNAAPVMAHEHWITVGDFTPLPGSGIEVFIQSGHEFPESTFGVRDDLVDEAVLMRPDGTSGPIETAMAEKMRTGAVRIDSEGTHLIAVTIKRPRMKDPFYEMKAIVVALGEIDDAAMYLRGEGLEIIPEARISSLGRGSVLPLSVMLDGKPIVAAVAVTHEGGKSVTLEASPDKPALLEISEAGRYLAKSAVKGRRCSLAFSVEAHEEGR